MAMDAPEISSHGLQGPGQSEETLFCAVPRLVIPDIRGLDKSIHFHRELWLGFTMIYPFQIFRKESMKDSADMLVLRWLRVPRNSV